MTGRALDAWHLNGPPSVWRMDLAILLKILLKLNDFRIQNGLWCALRGMHFSGKFECNNSGNSESEGVAYGWRKSRRSWFTPVTPASADYARRWPLSLSSPSGSSKFNDPLHIGRPPKMKTFPKFRFATRWPCVQLSFFSSSSFHVWRLPTMQWTSTFNSNHSGHFCFRFILLYTNR